MQPFATSAGLISPAVTNGGSPMGIAWLRNWITACAGGCQVVGFAVCSSPNISRWKIFYEVRYDETDMVCLS